jgi:S1-C subfamily serine protease
MIARTVFLAAIGAATVAPLAAQRERTPEPRRRVFVNGEEVNPIDWVANRRARIGVLVDMNAVDNDSIGATIEHVTPGGPAAKAGLRAGDIITRFDGQRLIGGERDQDRDRRRNDDEDDSLAGLKLIELVSKLEPGDTVAVEYRRGRETRTASVVTSAERSLAFREFGDGGPFTFEIPRVSGRGMQRLELPKMMARQPGDFMMAFGGPFAELELAPINPDLGAYFGTTEGVLVIDAPEKSTLGLKGGDVILSVDGRKARGPASLLRILRSYEEGDVIKLEVLRNKNNQTITSKVERDE